MIYDLVDAAAKSVVEPLKQKQCELNTTIEELRVAINTEDSKTKERQLRVELETAKKAERNLGYAIAAAEESAFKTLLAEEYGVVGNPKFARAYSIAYSYGHSAGFSDVENYFSELVELIK